MRATINPDDPPWGVATAVFVWLSSLMLMVFIPILAIVPYALYNFGGMSVAALNQAIAGDPNVLLITLAATIPTHLLMLGMVWGVVTGFGKRPFWSTIGWGWGRNFGIWKSAGSALVLLLVGGVVAYYLGGEKTPFEQMLESSTAARFIASFLATATAPLVEELIYRGVLYSALHRALGAVWAVVTVASLFTLVHVSQYYNNIGVIVAVGLLAFALTCVRAWTGRVLPCFIIHLIFNGLQVAGLIYEYFQPGKPAAETKAALFAFISYVT